MTTVGPSIFIKGELRSSDDVTIEGRVDGPVVCEASAVIIGASATVTGDLFARDITIFGRASGQFIATEVVDVRRDATVTGCVVSKRFILDPDARFTGRVEPQHLEAALRVARFEQRKRDSATPVSV